MVGELGLSHGKFDLRVMAFNHNGAFAVDPVVRLIAAKHNIIRPDAQQQALKLLPIIDDLQWRALFTNFTQYCQYFESLLLDKQSVIILLHSSLLTLPNDALHVPYSYHHWEYS
jgi:hypothetical protein